MGQSVVEVGPLKWFVGSIVAYCESQVVSQEANKHEKHDDTNDEHDTEMLFLGQEEIF